MIATCKRTKGLSDTILIGHRRGVETAPPSAVCGSWARVLLTRGLLRRLTRAGANLRAPPEQGERAGRGDESGDAGCGRKAAVVALGS